jgi:signal transduction histidine kinase
VTRLPQPNFEPVDLGPLVERVVGLETRLPVEIAPGPALSIPADAGQIEQALINLLRNAVDAALETQGGVRVAWTRRGASIDIEIEDEGPGVGNTSNLFVPFYTTKKGGSGIGLVLSRQIAEAHHGILTLQNRDPGPGCRALLSLPAESNGRG